MSTTESYAIRVQGHLDRRWESWFDGMTLTRDPDGATSLHGSVPDQAALFGLLHKVRDAGLPLISVTRTPPAQPDQAEWLGFRNRRPP